MKRFGIWAASAAVALSAVATSAHAIEPFRSMRTLTSSNGRGAIIYDRTTYRITQFLEHAYRYPEKGVESRNFAFDSYPGIRVGGTGAWLANSAPTRIEYVNGTGIVHTERTVSGVQVDEYHFAPMSLGENASIMLVKVKRLSGSGAIDAYGLFNYHLGSGSPVAGADGEQALYVSSRDAVYEWGPSGKAFAYGSIGTSTHHAVSPGSIYDALNSGANLGDSNDTGGAKFDVAAGFQTALGDLAVNQEAWAGWYTVYDAGADAQAAADRVRTWLAGRSPGAVYAGEVADWAAWHKALPTGLSTEEAEVAKQSLAVLRMAQVTEPGAPNGQMLASLAPGRWNIAWVRDMSYAVVALIRTGHYAEAKAAIEFQMKGQTGEFQSYVGSPYRISVVRYYGNGVEESDSNEDGPNVEFDGFGLFLWQLEEYVRASGDTSLLTTHWPKASTEIADVLVKLQEPNGLIAADSSIWEVHWNGKQRHFAYTTITAANGLCRAAELAKKAGDAALETKYRDAGIRARDAILSQLRAPDLTIAQSTEGLAQKSKFLDASAVEAMNFGLIYPTRKTARATLASFKKGLVPPTGRGFMRSDIGAWYDSQEWVFVDFRTSRALERIGDITGAKNSLTWNLGQARENFNLFSELHDRDTAAYVGEAPMIGFGAGSFMIELDERGKAVTPTCGTFADEPADELSDAGVDEDAASGDASTVRTDGGTGRNPTGHEEDDDGCSASPVGNLSSRSLSSLFLGMIGFVIYVARRRNTK